MTMITQMKRIPDNIQTQDIKLALSPIVPTSLKILADSNAEIIFNIQDFTQLITKFPTLKLYIKSEEFRIEVAKESSKTVVLNRIPGFVSQDDLQIFTNQYLLSNNVSPSFVNIFMSKARTQSANCVFLTENDAKAGLSVLFPVKFSEFLMAKIGKNYLKIIDTAEADARNGKVSDNEVFQVVARGYDQKIVESNQVQVSQKEKQYEYKQVNVSGAINLNSVVVGQKVQKVTVEKAVKSCNSAILVNLPKICTENDIDTQFSVFGEIIDIQKGISGKSAVFTVYYKSANSVVNLIQNRSKIVVLGNIVGVKPHVIKE